MGSIFAHLAEARQFFVKEAVMVDNRLSLFQQCDSSDLWESRVSMPSPNVIATTQNAHCIFVHWIHVITQK